ncbi:MAG: hypothetical protein ACUVQ0_03160 [Thermoproteota archaeon]
MIGVKASEVFKDFNLVVVTHHTGFRELGLQELVEGNCRAIDGNRGWKSPIHEDRVVHFE